MARTRSGMQFAADTRVWTKKSINKHIYMAFYLSLLIFYFYEFAWDEESGSEINVGLAMVEGGWDRGTGGTKREAKEMKIEQYKTQVPWRQCPAPEMR